MKAMKLLQAISVAAAAALLLSGCATRLPEPIRGDGTETTSYRPVVERGDDATGTALRWGGVIAAVHNRKDHSEIEVVYFTLRGTGRPWVTNETPGRFRFVVDGFADPEVYRLGREVTVLGDLRGFETDLIGEYEFSFPVMTARGVQLWREDPQRIEVWHRDPMSPWYRHYLYGTGPYRYHPYYFPYGTRPIQRAPERSSPPEQQRPRRQETESPRSRTDIRQQQ
ncbi:starvation-inducible protein [Aliidiomarina halalkaliphila]|uniref:Starvation-inducible protein n=1 Tax=Aliidiomarina halalkaliphila TaxID=2593535 RepID=A0A552X511_9GAMM|nr:Slp family lipoprotein [Aliidiomarina halalkaliphila]TRW50100.1 starvation-inducible protein [Aliidiomarina halalkaliphila]